MSMAAAIHPDAVDQQELSLIAAADHTACDVMHDSP